MALNIESLRASVRRKGRYRVCGFALDPDQHIRMRAVCAREGITVSEFIRFALSAALDALESEQQNGAEERE
jgi:hypothetical protein